MKHTLLFLLFITPLLTYAQGGPGSNGPNFTSVSVPGYIEVPVLMDLNISTNNMPQLTFSSIDDYTYGKVVNAIANFNVKSSCPWLITISAPEEFAHSGNNNVPVSIFSFKENLSDNFIPISTTPQTFLMSSNSNIENNYSVDLKVKPNFGSQSGLYSTNVIFTLTKQ